MGKRSIADADTAGFAAETPLAAIEFAAIGDKRTAALFTGALDGPTLELRVQDARLEPGLSHADLAAEPGSPTAHLTLGRHKWSRTDLARPLNSRLSRLRQSDGDHVPANARLGAEPAGSNWAAADLAATAALADDIAALHCTGGDDR